MIRENDMSEINVGDVVRLKSGGPAMTVAGVSKNNTSACLCKWFSGFDVKEYIFEALALEKVDGVNHGGG